MLLPTPGPLIAASATSTGLLQRSAAVLRPKSAKPELDERPYSPHVDLHVGRGAGLHLQINGRPVDNGYGAILMAELAALREEFRGTRRCPPPHPEAAEPRPRWHA
jgi:hypothetical protein